MSKQSGHVALEKLKRQDLQDWLHIHNTSVAEVHKKRLVKEKYRNLVLADLESHIDPEDGVRSFFVNPFLKGEENAPIADDNHVDEVIDTILRSHTNRKRVDIGIHPVTLLAESRRRAIINSLINKIHVDEEVKQNSSNPLSSPEQDLKKVDNPTSSLSIINRSVKLPSIASSSSSAKKELADRMSKRIFYPKWDDYNTMRSRWKYIQPQVKHLLGDNEQISAPVTYQNFINVGSTVLNGNLQDVDAYVKTNQLFKTRDFRIREHSQNAENLRIQNETKRYIPSHSVRWS